MKPKSKRRFWTDAEIERLRELYPDHSSREVARRLNRTVCAVHGTAQKLGIEKTPEYLARECRLKKGSQIGREFRYAKGHVPANKGLRRPGWSTGRMRETQFKKGQRSHTWKPVGTILADHEGFLRIKVRERRPGDAQGWDTDVWPLLHHQVWIKHHGAIPAKHVVVFKDRNRQNCAIANLELITMRANMLRNSIWKRLPRELAETIMLNGALKRKLRRLANGQKQDQRSERSPVRDARATERSR